MVVSKFGVSFNSGKSLMKWNQFFQVLSVMTNQKVVTECQKNIANLVEFSDMQYNQQVDQSEINRIAHSLGVRPTKTIQGTKNRIALYFQQHNNGTSDLEIIRM